MCAHQSYPDETNLQLARGRGDWQQQELQNARVRSSRAEEGIWKVWNPYWCGLFFLGGDHYRLWTPLFRGFGLKGTGVWFYSFEILLAKGSNCPVSLLLRGFLV